MPELPETETIARDLDAEIRDAVVSRVTVLRSDVLREASADEFARALMGARVLRVWRRAKLVIVDFAASSASMTTSANATPEAATWHMVVQPRFTGGLLIARGPLPPEVDAFICVTLTLSDGRQLHYRDVRRLGTVALMSPERLGKYSAAIGPEPLDPALGDAEFSVLLRAPRQAIKVVLMDQRRLAGVGNIYANEALWRAGIDPSRESRSLEGHETSALLHALREVLLASIEARGTSFRDYRDARGERGRFVEQLAVYGRAGAPCTRCGRRLVGTHAIDGRSTVFCPGCQH
jgi:formamidopyrimidine-DNA glycosylase